MAQCSCTLKIEMIMNKYIFSTISTSLSSAMYLPFIFHEIIQQVDEEKGDRKFGGCPFARLPVRDVSANMRVTAKQIRYKGANKLLL